MISEIQWNLFTDFWEDCCNENKVIWAYGSSILEPFNKRRRFKISYLECQCAGMFSNQEIQQVCWISHDWIQQKKKPHEFMVPSKC